MLPCGCEGSVGEYGIVCINSKVLSVYLLCLLKIAAGRLIGFLGWLAAWLSTIGTCCMTFFWNIMRFKRIITVSIIGAEPPVEGTLWDVQTHLRSRWSESLGEPLRLSFQHVTSATFIQSIRLYKYRSLVFY